MSQKDLLQLYTDIFETEKEKLLLYIFKQNYSKITFQASKISGIIYFASLADIITKEKAQADIKEIDNLLSTF